MKKLKFLFNVLLLTYIGLCGYLYFTQESKIFKGDKAVKVELLPFIDNLEEVSFETEKGLTLYGKHKIALNSEKPMILYFGGNSSDITSFFNYTTKLDEYEIISFNYRGYINSQGSPSEDKFFEDALKIYDNYGKNKEVIVVGKSLGTGVATFLASKREVKTLVLITPYDSIVSMAKKKYPIFPIDFLLKHKFESIKYIKEVKTPVVLFEVKGDEVIKKYHFDRLKDEVKNLKNHLVFTDISHGNILSHRDFQWKLKENLN
jgi:hypothetical protein